MLISNIYDDVYGGKLEGGWGFSCYIEHEGRKILFDTGYDGSKLFHNMEEMGIEPALIDTVIVSHNHWDHTGGVTALSRVNKRMVIYVGETFSAKFRGEVSRNNECKPVREMVSLYEGNVFVGPELGNNGERELALAIRSRKGLVIVTGCAHPGIMNIVREFKNKINERIFLVLGGFHLYEHTRSEVEDIAAEFKNMGIRKVAPCHCSGREPMEVFRKEYRDDFIEFRAGARIEF